MAQSNKKLIMLGSLLLAGSVNAGGPGFDGIVVNLNTDTAPRAEGAGFLQQEVTLNTGTYIQTVIIDAFPANNSTSGSDPNDVMVSWLGQGVTPGETGSSTFGFQSVDDINDAEDAISTFSTDSSAFSTASPFAWDTTNFGEPPSLVLVNLNQDTLIREFS